MSISLSLISCGDNLSRYEIPSSKPEFTSEQLIGLLNAKIERNPANGDVYFWKSRELLKMGKAEEAYRSIMTGIDLNPNSEPYRLHQIAILLELESFDKALELAMDLKLNGVNDYASLNEYLAEIYYEKKQFDLAQKHFDEAIGINPYEPSFYYRRGLMFMHSKDSTKAEYNFKKVLKLNPYHKDVIAALSSIYIMTDRKGESAKLLESFDFSDPSNSSFTLERARLAKEMTEYDLCDSLLHLLTTQDSKNSIYFNELAELKLILRQYDSSKFYIKRALAIEPGNRFSKLTEARLFDKKDQLYSARSIYLELINSDTTDYIARNELEKLNGKIAYLRRIDSERQERAKLPTLELKRIE